LNRHFEKRFLSFIILYYFQDELQTPLFGITGIFFLIFFHQMKKKKMLIFFFPKGILSLLQKTQLTEEQTEFVNTIQLCSNELLCHIGNILDFMKLQQKKMTLWAKRFFLRDCIEQAFETILIMAAKKNVEITYSIDDASLPTQLIGDPLRLEQVLQV
jgi:signal transduction histidine kinase